MSVYSTQTVTREEAIKMLESVRPRTIYEMTNEELAEELFNKIGREDLPNSPCHNYIVEV